MTPTLRAVYSWIRSFSAARKLGQGFRQRDGGDLRGAMQTFHVTLELLNDPRVDLKDAAAFATAVTALQSYCAIAQQLELTAEPRVVLERWKEPLRRWLADPKTGGVEPLPSLNTYWRWLLAQEPGPTDTQE